MVKFVSAYTERDKKNLKKMDFWSELSARLIDFTPLRRRGGFISLAVASGGRDEEHSVNIRKIPNRRQQQQFESHFNGNSRTDFVLRRGL